MKLTRFLFVFLILLLTYQTGYGAKFSFQDRKERALAKKRKKELKQETNSQSSEIGQEEEEIEESQSFMPDESEGPPENF
jgi:uncharacterized protein YlxW (UPF0749 family)